MTAEKNTAAAVVAVAPLSDQWRKLAEQICPDADRFALEYAGEVSQRLGLSMFTSPAQIVLIGRYDSRVGKTVYRPQVTVDGRLALAVRTGKVVGLEGPHFTGPRSEWTDPVGQRVWIDVWDCKDEGAYPRAARYLIHIDRYTRPVNGTAPWLEFAQRDKNHKLLPLWARMPTTMLAKAALSLGLRRSGIENLPADIAVGYEGDTLEADPALAAGHGGETPVPAAGVPLPVPPGRDGTTEHHTVGQENNWLVCSCGQREATAWAMSVHRQQATGEPPDDVYDDSPESRGHVDDVQPASYDDPGRPFADPDPDPTA